MKQLLVSIACLISLVFELLFPYPAWFSLSLRFFKFVSLSLVLFAFKLNG
ncbi:unnamed protein product [Brassica oleracea var. botrytis]|uniref:(rape) hypothetical protein n=1 Tax=Brassica napus TaxID=3708 RepID=A0A816JAZ2_BRANA|nr:unnamed protein product [Brassica napus]